MDDLTIMTKSAEFYLRPVDENRSPEPAKNENKITKSRNKKLSYRRHSARWVKRPFNIIQGHPLLYQSTRRIWLPT